MVVPKDEAMIRVKASLSHLSDSLIELVDSPKDRLEILNNVQDLLDAVIVYTGSSINQEQKINMLKWLRPESEL